MGKNGCRVDDDDAEQRLIVLRLQCDKGDGKDVCDDEDFVEHLCTDAVSLPCPQVVCDANDGTKDDEGSRDDLLKAEHRVVEERCKRCYLCEVVDQPFLLSRRDGVGSEEPVGCQQPKEGCQKRLDVHGIQFRCCQNPQYRDEGNNLYAENAGDTHT